MQVGEPLDGATRRLHAVHLYKNDERGLTASVARYLADGAERGEGLLVVADPGHVAAFRRELRRLYVGVRLAERRGWLRVVDAQEALATFMVDGYPDWKRFKSHVGALIAETRAAVGGKGLRIYGEMVGLLWGAGQYPCAIRVEQLWNRLRKTVPFDLYCGYPIEVFDKQFEMGVMDALLCAHTNLVAADRNDDLTRALGRAMEEVLQTKPELLRPFIGAARSRAWGVVPLAEGTILWLRNDLPEHADEILARARAYYYKA
jgi:hypothetical protein